MQLDKKLWLRIGEDDHQAYAEACRFFYKRFYNYGMKFTKDESLVEDAVQESLLTIWDKRQNLASIEYTSTYFYTLFRYTLFNKLKQQRKFLFLEMADEEPDFPVDQIIIAKETDKALQQQLEKALEALTPRQREAIFLRFYEGLSYEEVAAVLQITIKGTYKIIARAIQQLRENLPSCIGLIIFLKEVFPAK